MKNGIYTKEITIDFCDCDNKKQTKIASIMRYMAEVAGYAYANKGYTHTWLWERDFVFLLSRVSIHIERMPKAEETITIQTWEKAVKGILYYRDFIIYDANQNILIEASTAWVLANPKTRQIVKPSTFTGKLDLVDKDVNTLAVTRLKIPQQLSVIGERKVVYSDIDGNNHVHNAVYASIACDFLPTQLIEKDLIDFRINFKKEATIGDTMELFINISDSVRYVVGKVGDTVSFECEFTFKSTKNT